MIFYILTILVVKRRESTACGTATIRVVRSTTFSEALTRRAAVIESRDMEGAQPRLGPKQRNKRLQAFSDLHDLVPVLQGQNHYVYDNIE